MISYSMRKQVSHEDLWTLLFPAQPEDLRTVIEQTKMQAVFAREIIFC